MFQHLNKNQNRGALSLVITIIAVLAIVIGGILIWQFWYIFSSPTSTETPEDETADWNIYRSEELGIEFKYPKEWGEPCINEKKGFVILDASLLRKPGECEYYGQPRISIYSITEEGMQKEYKKYQSAFQECLNNLDNEDLCKDFEGDYANYTEYRKHLLREINVIKKIQEEQTKENRIAREVPIDGLNFDCSALGGYMILRVVKNENLNNFFAKTIGHCGYDFPPHYYYFTSSISQEKRIEFSHYEMPTSDWSKLYKNPPYPSFLDDLAEELRDCLWNDWQCENYPSDMKNYIEKFEEKTVQYDNIIKSIKLINN